MTESSTPTERSKKQRDNTKRHQICDFTTIADRLRTVSLSSDRHPTGVVNRFTGSQPSKLTPQSSNRGYKHAETKRRRSDSVP